VVPESYHDFFVGSLSVAGALIGLLFVAISVAAPRLNQAEGRAQAHRIRADAALTAFTNALTVSLFALVPGQVIGWTAVATAAVGIVFIAASVVSLARVKVQRWLTARDAVFLVGMATGFVFQLLAGLHLERYPHDAGDVQNIAILVIVFFLVGISRAWELVGGPSLGLRREVTALVRGEALAPGDVAADPETQRRAEEERAGEGEAKPEAELPPLT
jgi:hypothetical protein